jgi:hypothetical protein
MHIVNSSSGSYLVWFGVKAGTEGDIPHHKDGRKGRGTRQRQQGVSTQGQSRGDPANQVRECHSNSQSEESPKKLYLHLVTHTFNFFSPTERDSSGDEGWNVR